MKKAHPNPQPKKTNGHQKMEQSKITKSDKNSQVSKANDEISLENEVNNHIVPKIIQVVSLANTTAQSDDSNATFNEPEVDEMNKSASVKDSNLSSNKVGKSRRKRKKNKASSNMTMSNSPNNNINNNKSHLLDTDNADNGDGDSTSIIRPNDCSNNINSNSLFKYSGNNIEVVFPSNSEFNYTSAGSTSQSIPPSCIDNTSSACGRYYSYNSGDERASDGSSIGLDLETEYDDLNSTLKNSASWCLNNGASNVDYEDFNPQITNVRSLSNAGAGPIQKSSYQSLSSFQIGSDQSSSIADMSRVEAENLISSVFSETSPSYTTSSSTRTPSRLCEAPNCSNQARTKCTQCSVYYCSEQHKKADRKAHNRICKPYILESVGLGSDGLPVEAAVASRNIPPGQIIFEETPMLIFPLVDTGLNSQFCNVMDLACIRERLKNPKCLISCRGNRPACLGCMGLMDEDGQTNRKCNTCHLPICSDRCQYLENHRSGECEALHRLRSSFGNLYNSASCIHTLYMDIEILRALQLDGELDDFGHSQLEVLREMKNNVRVEAYKKTNRFSLFAQNINFLVPLSAKKAGYDYDLIKDVHAIISSLSFRPSAYSTFKLLFSTQPIFAHDCVPNTLHYIEDEHTGDPSKMKLLTKAACPIIKNKLITVDFVPSPFFPYPLRRKILQDILSIINCLCIRCRDPQSIGDLTAEINCPSCRCGTVYPETPQVWQDSVWSCRSCHEDIPYLKIQEIENECLSELGSLIYTRRDRVRSIIDFIRRRGPLDLNPRHHIIITAWCAVESKLRLDLRALRDPDPSYVYSDEVISKFEILGYYTDVVLEHLNAIRPGIFIDKGIALFHKFYSTFVKVSREFQTKIINRKEFINEIIRCLKILKTSLETLNIYNGYNEPNVTKLTKEATQTLNSLKIYADHLTDLEKQALKTPLPILGQVVGPNRCNNYCSND